MQDKWIACLEYLRQNISTDIFETWAKPLRFISYDQRTLTLEIPGRIFVEQMMQHMGTQLGEAIYHAYGRQTKVAWRLPHNEDPNAHAGKATTSTQTMHPGGVHTPAATQPLAPRPTPFESFLNEDYSFEHFCEGRSNLTALKVAKAIAQHPDAQTFNPFFLYGASGIGKTHLANAIGLEIKRNHPQKRVLFVAATTFKTQYMDAAASRNNKINDFIHFYQTIDVLIIDDFQEIKTPKTQHAFFHIFNHLQSLNRKIIITCDRPPSQFEGIEERMLTRLKWGVVVEMERPDIELRRSILHAKLHREGITSFPEDVIQYIVENVSDSVRELQGMINSILVFSMGNTTDQCTIDIALAQRIIPRLVNQARKELTFEKIMKHVCEYTQLKNADICSKSRKSNIVAARHLVCYLTHKYTTTSLSQIGRQLGGRDHSTILHSCTLFEKKLSTDKRFRREIEDLENRLGEHL